jgi:hypothetical protein
MRLRSSNVIDSATRRKLISSTTFSCTSTCTTTTRRPTIINAKLQRHFSTTTTTTTTTTQTSQKERHNPKKNERLLVVGSGVAGSSAALIAAETYKIPVTLLFAGNVPQDCNSFWAQGGIIYRNYDPASGDSAESLANDIHRAGAGLCNDDAVRKVSTEGPDRVRELLLSGGPFADVPFDKKPDGELSLCLGTLWNLLFSCRPHILLDIRPILTNKKIRHVSSNNNDQNNNRGLSCGT